jgi:uncharacterized RDD family membrane protein YckC
VDSTRPAIGGTDRGTVAAGEPLDSRPPKPSLTPTTMPTPAGLFRRLAALCYDALLLLGIMVLVTLAVWAARGGREVPPGTVWFQAVLVAIAAVFYAWFWTHGGQTLGMKAWRIRLERVDGRPMTFARAVARFLTAWLVALPLGVGYLWSLIDRDRACWHDRLTRTRIVRDPSVSAPESVRSR